MFESIRNSKRIAQIILALLVIPFAFFGMESYFRDGPGRGEVASVAGSKISTAAFEEALRQEQDRLRNASEGKVDQKTLESPELRQAVLDNLINQRVLALYAAKHDLVATSEQLQEMIVSVPAFQENGKFSLQRYQDILRGQGMTPAVFEARLGQDLRTQQVAQAAGDAAFVATPSAQRFLLAQLEEREVRELSFSPASYVDKVKLAEGAARRYYDANQDKFQRQARLRAEYVVLDEATVGAKVAVTEEQMRQFYDANQQRFGVPEERRARHILIEVPSDATPEQIAQAKEKAQSILSSLRADPSRFEALARSESQDKGSAAQGGDLGFFGRGAMVKPFEDAAFALKKDEISDLVRSDFGFHIIQVTDIKPASLKPFAEVKDQIADEIRRQEAGRRFAELAEQFSNTVYEQADSLKPAADLVGAQIKTTDWIERGSDSIGPYHSQRLVESLFSDDAVKNKRNTDAVEVDNNTLVAAHVAEYEPAKKLAFDEVKDAIEQQLRTEEAAKLAEEAGKAALAALKKGESVEGKWSDEARKLQRGLPSVLPAAMQAIFGAPADKLPAYVGVSGLGGGYTIYRVESVKRPELGKDDPRLKALSGQYQRVMAERDFSAFLAMLRERYEVKVDATAVVKASQQQ